MRQWMRHVESSGAQIMADAVLARLHLPAYIRTDLYEPRMRKEAPPMIDKNKQYRTRDGREVRIYATDGMDNGVPAVHGAFKSIWGWLSRSWRADGKFTGADCDHDLDLIEVKPRIKREVWVNVYPGGIVGMRYTKADADDDAMPDRIACVKITIDCEEGEGL